MAKIFSTKNLKLEKNNSGIDEFEWHSSEALGDLSNSKYLHFNIQSLEPGKYSYPYHSHRNAEELFLIIKGVATLRTPKGFSKIAEGDLIFFEEGEQGAHQLFNHGKESCLYLDLRTRANVDICDYPDSKKISILPSIEVFESDSAVSYYKGEEGVGSIWPQQTEE